LNSCLDFGFIARFVGTSGNNREAIMLGQFAVSGIQFRFIAAGMLDCRFRVVGIMWRAALCVGGAQSFCRQASILSIA
jgi:hypothetical protein